MIDDNDNTVYNHERDFKGVWIDRELYLNNELSWIEKILYLEIDSLTKQGKSCYKSNAYFARFLGIKETQVSRHIKKLKEIGMVEQVGFDGRKRYLRSCFVQKDMRDISKSTEQSCTKVQSSHVQKYKQSNKYSNTISNKVSIKDSPSQITERNSEKEKKPELESHKETEIDPSKQQSFDFVQWFYDNMDKPTRYRNKAPDLNKWVEPIDRLLRIDKVEYTEMKRVALFALRDDFWKTNILSTANFRKHYDKLEKQSRVKNQKKGVTSTIDQDEFYRLYGGGQ